MIWQTDRYRERQVDTERDGWERRRQVDTEKDSEKDWWIQREMGERERWARERQVREVCVLPGHNICWCTCKVHEEQQDCSSLRRNSADRQTDRQYYVNVTLFPSVHIFHVISVVQFVLTDPRQFSQSGVHLLITAWCSAVDITVIPVTHTHTHTHTHTRSQK